MKLLIDIGQRHDGGLKEWTEEMLRLRVRAALLACQGNVVEAAEWLGTSRHTVYRHLRSDNADTEDAVLTNLQGN